MPEKTISLADRVRLAVEASGLSLYAVAKQTGLSEPTVGRIMRPEHWGTPGGLSIETAELVMEMLGFTVTDPPGLDTASPAALATVRRRANGQKRPARKRAAKKAPR